MRATATRLFQESPITQLTRPWKKFRDGTLFYGESKNGNRRGPLSTKQGNKNFYKGTRSSGIGKHTTLGKYVIQWFRVRTYVMPKQYNTELKPLVDASVPELKQNFKGYSKGPFDTKLYFNKLKSYIKNGEVQSKASDVNCLIEKS